MSNREDTICFAYNESHFPKGPLTFFESFPIIKIKLRKDSDSDPNYFTWFPSEYLYRLNNQEYCFAAERTWNNEVMMGGTLIR